METRHTARQALSLTLALAIICWADSSLAMLPMSVHGAQCLAGILASPHQAVPTAQAAMPGCHHHPGTTIRPVVTTVATLVASHCEDQHACCKLTRPAARPSQIITVPGRSRTSTLNAGGAGLEKLDRPRLRSAFLAGDSPPPIRQVLDQKTDLRI